MKRRGLALVGMLVVATACTPSGFDPLDARYSATRITPSDDHPNEVYGLAVLGMEQLALSSPAGNQGWNSRAAFYPTGQARVADATVCETWAGPASPISRTQPGLALRVTPTRSITVTKNVVNLVFSNINVNFWIGSGGRSKQEAGQSMSFEPLLHQGRGIAPFPWHICSRASGATLTTKIWLDGEPEPGWNPTIDPVHVQAVAVPGAAWVYPGNFGGYIGHLGPGLAFLITDLEVTRARAVGAIRTGTPPAARRSGRKARVRLETTASGPVVSAPVASKSYASQSRSTGPTFTSGMLGRQSDRSTPLRRGCGVAPGLVRLL